MSGNEENDAVEEETVETDVDAEDASGAVGRLRRLGRRIMDRKDLADDTREILGAVLETSDRAKTEVVKLVAREVRTYLQELRVMDDLKGIMTSHSLELNVSMNLKPLLTKAESETTDEKPRGTPVAEDASPSGGDPEASPEEAE